MRRRLLLVAGAMISAMVAAPLALAAPAPTATPGIGISINGGSGTSPSTTVQIIALLTVLAVAPSILIAVTSFTRIVVVLGMLRTAIGTPQIPPNQVIMVLALFLTLFTMSPTLSQVNKVAYQPYSHKQINASTALKRAQEPIREFMFKQTNEKDIALLLEIQHKPLPKVRGDVSTLTLVPAFMLSELKTAFEIGVVIFIPFLVIDLIVAAVLMSLGMFMVPPASISLPLKLLLFILVDGWALIVRSLAGSFF